MGKIYEALLRAEESETQRAGGGNGTAERLLPIISTNGFDPQKELVVLGKPGSAIAEQFRFWRSQVICPQDNFRPRTIQITSSLQGEGKTFAACNLAVTISQGLDEHVLLVDMDMRNSRMSRIFGFKEDVRGLSAHLAEDTPLEELLKKTKLKKLTILPAGTSVDKPAELVSSSRMKDFIKEVRDRYPDRYVIIDSPPIEMAPESLVISKEVDGIFLMVLRAKTPRDRVATSLEKLQKEKFLGVILNGDQQPNKQYQGYKYEKGYSYSYGYCYK